MKCIKLFFRCIKFYRVTAILAELDTQKFVTIDKHRRDLPRQICPWNDIEKHFVQLHLRWSFTLHILFYVNSVPCVYFLFSLFRILWNFVPQIRFDWLIICNLCVFPVPILKHYSPHSSTNRTTPCQTMHSSRCKIWNNQPADVATREILTCKRVSRNIFCDNKPTAAASASAAFIGIDVARYNSN